MYCGPGTAAFRDVCLPDGGGSGTSSGGGGSGTAVGSGGGSSAVGSGGGSPSGVGGGGGSSTGGGGGATSSAGGGPPQDKYAVLVSASKVPSDGYSAIPVLAIGLLANDKASMEQVLLTVNPGTAGTLSPATLMLGPLGGPSTFTPCNSAQQPSCKGTFTVELALAKDPKVVVASSDIVELVTPTGVGSPAPCLLGGDTLYFDGDAGDYIHPGKDTINAGSWSASGSDFLVSVNVNPSNSKQGSYWSLQFSSNKLNKALNAQVYEGAERYPFEPPGKPGLSITGSGKGCNTLSGRFQIHELTSLNGTITGFTATFEQHCEKGAAALRGCVHYQN